MNLKNHTRTFPVLCLCAIAIFASKLTAQESSVEVIEPSRITESLISRGELNRLLNQQEHDINPLRKNQLEPDPPIIDTLVQPASWVEDVQQHHDHAPPEAIDVPETQEPQVIGPMPSMEMQSLFDKLDMLLEINVDNLKEEVSCRQASIDTSVGIDESEKTQKLQQLKTAESAAESAKQNVDKKAAYQHSILTLNEDLEKLRLESKEEIKPEAVDQSQSVESMQTLLRDLQAELDHEKSNVLKIQERIQQRDQRMSRIPAERSDSRGTANSLHEELLQKQSTGTEEIETLLALRARELAASTNVQLLDQESKWYDLSREKLPLEKSVLKQKIQRVEQQINALNNAIAARKQAELEAQIRLARQSAFKTHPALQKFMEQTTELAQARASLAEKTGALQNEKLKVDQQFHDVETQRKDLEGSIAENGEEESRSLLIEIHRKLTRPYEGMARIQNLKSERRATRGKIVELRSKQDRVSNPATFIREQLNIEHDEVVADTTLVAMAEEAVETHQKQLSELIGDTERYGNLIGEVLEKRENLIGEISATRKLVDTHAMWVQSADPLSVSVLTKSREGADEFFEPELWGNLGDSILDRVTHRPYECLVGMMGLLFAFVIGRRFKD